MCGQFGGYSRWNIRFTATKTVLMRCSYGTDGQQSGAARQFVGERWSRRSTSTVVYLVCLSLPGCDNLLSSDGGRRLELYTPSCCGCELVPLASSLHVLPSLFACPVATQLQLADRCVVVGRRAGSTPLRVQLTRSFTQQPTSQPRSSDDVPRAVRTSLHDPLHGRVAGLRPAASLTLRSRRCRRDDVIGCSSSLFGELLLEEVLL